MFQIAIKHALSAWEEMNKTLELNQKVETKHIFKRAPRLVEAKFVSKASQQKIG